MTIETQTTRYDPADYLDPSDPEDIGNYLEIMLEENGIQGLQAALGHVAKARGMSEIARQTGLSRESLYRSLADSGKPQLDTIDKVLRALGLKLGIRSAKADNDTVDAA